jgi:hypothetical protein
MTAAAAWVASDYWEMAKRSLRHIRHDPEQLVNVTLQPVLIVVLMDLLFGGAIKTGTHGSYVNFVMPGILVVAAAFARSPRRSASRPTWAKASSTGSAPCPWPSPPSSPATSSPT